MILDPFLNYHLGQHVDFLKKYFCSCFTSIIIISFVITCAFQLYIPTVQWSFLNLLLAITGMSCNEPEFLALTNDQL